MWRAAGLEEPNGRGAPQGKGEAAGEAGWEPGAQVDNLEAGGFLARFGREPERAVPPVTPVAPVPTTADVDSDDD